MYQVQPGLEKEVSFPALAFWERDNTAAAGSGSKMPRQTVVILSSDAI